MSAWVHRRDPERIFPRSEGAGRTRKATFPPGQRHPGSQTGERPASRSAAEVPEGMLGLPAAAARVSMEASGENSATLTPDPRDPSTSYTPRAPKHSSGLKNQAATLLTQEEGGEPKHSCQAKYQLHRRPFSLSPPPQVGGIKSPAETMFFPFFYFAVWRWLPVGRKTQASRGLQITALLISSRANYTPVCVCCAPSYAGYKHLSVCAE